MRQSRGSGLYSDVSLHHASQDQADQMLEDSEAQPMHDDAVFVNRYSEHTVRADGVLQTRIIDHALLIMHGSAMCAQYQPSSIHTESCNKLPEMHTTSSAASRV